MNLYLNKKINYFNCDLFIRYYSLDKDYSYVTKKEFSKLMKPINKENLYCTFKKIDVKKIISKIIYKEIEIINYIFNNINYVIIENIESNLFINKTIKDDIYLINYFTDIISNDNEINLLKRRLLGVEYLEKDYHDTYKETELIIFRVKINKILSFNNNKKILLNPKNSKSKEDDFINKIKENILLIIKEEAEKNVKNINNSISKSDNNYNSLRNKIKLTKLF